MKRAQSANMIFGVGHCFVQTRSLHSGQALSGFTLEEGVTEQMFKPDRSFTGGSIMDETMTKALKVH